VLERAGYGAGRDRSRVLRRIALMVSITPHSQGGELRLSDLDTQRELNVESGSFVLMLENEPRDTFARGQLKVLRDGTTYPVQSNVALFEMLKELIDRAAGTD